LRGKREIKITGFAELWFFLIFEDRPQGGFKKKGLPEEALFDHR